MRTGAAHGHVGYFHEAAFYGSDDDYRSFVVPFVDEGVAAGEPVVVACREANERLVRDAVADPSGVVFVPGGDQYDRPTEAILGYRKLFAEYAGVAQIRVVGDVPHPGVGASWDWWARYEAAVNEVFAEYPLWGLCPYDLRTTRRACWRTWRGPTRGRSGRTVRTSPTRGTGPRGRCRRPRRRGSRRGGRWWS